MAGNLRDYRRRIRSVKNTAQLTRAMKMVAAAKLRRSQEAMLAARPYAGAMRRVLAEVARRAHPELHPLLARRPLKTVDLLVVTGDRGLCGAFNTNILKAADQWRTAREAEGIRVEVTAIGRKAADYVRRRKQITLREARVDFLRVVEFAAVRELAAALERRFTAGETDGVFIAFNEFRSTISQRVVVSPLLPLSELSSEAGHEDGTAETEYIYEPGPQELLDQLLTRFVAFQLFHAFLESTAAENAARMTAMENATRNANEVIGKLTLEMNRIRQASITKEIIEVVSGAEALG